MVSLKPNIFCAIRCMYQSFPINLSNNISFASQAVDDVGAVPEINDGDTSLSGELSPDGNLNKGLYASVSL